MKRTFGPAGRVLSNKQHKDAKHWPEILGKDDVRTLELSDVAESEATGESAPLGKVAFSR